MVFVDILIHRFRWGFSRTGFIAVDLPKRIREIGIQTAATLLCAQILFKMGFSLFLHCLLLVLYLLLKQ